jgi:hypothetical protein
VAEAGSWAGHPAEKEGERASAIESRISAT